MTLLEFAQHAPRPANYDKTEWAKLLLLLTGDQVESYNNAQAVILHNPTILLSAKAWVILFITARVQFFNFNLVPDLELLSDWLKSQPQGLWLDKLSINFDSTLDKAGWCKSLISLQTTNSKQKRVYIHSKHTNFNLLIETRGFNLIEMITAAVKSISK